MNDFGFLVFEWRKHDKTQEKTQNMNQSVRYERILRELPQDLPDVLPNLYDILLMKYPDYFHHVVQDITNCKSNDVRKAKCEDISEVIKFFIGSTPHKQKEALVEFLTLMPEYKTTDQDALIERLKLLTEEMKKAGDIMDPLHWAMYKIMKYNQTLENNA